MSNLSGYDSEATGFESILQKRRPEADSGTQTTEYSESGTSSQTNMSKECGSMTNPDDFVSKETLNQTEPDLNEFLRRVVPGVLEQLDQNDKETNYTYNSSDSDSEETISAKLAQEFSVRTDLTSLRAGDYQSTVLSISWSSAGNSLAVSIGQNQHENWCQHDGLIRIYTLKRSEGDKFVHNLDISEKNCISTVLYHPSIAALLAYGTVTGEVVVCNLCNSNRSFDNGMSLTSPSDCHGARRVSALQWADAALANAFLMIHINNTAKRRSASDQVLLSSGSDGTINAWQVNSNAKTFTNIICYSVNGSRKMAAPDITCFDFIKTFPLRPSDEKVATDIFAVGTGSGTIYLCDTKKNLQVDKMFDPVYEVLEGHLTCVIDIAFSCQKAGIFASISMDSELRIYDINQTSPLKVVCLDVKMTCMSWLPNNPSAIVVGTAGDDELVMVFDITTGRKVHVEGFNGRGTVSCIAVRQAGTCHIAAGNVNASVQIWEVPSRLIRLVPEDFDF